VQDIIIIKFLIFAHYSTKTHLFLDKSMIKFCVTKLQICDNEHDHGLKDARMYGISTNEKSEIFVDNYISHDILFLAITLQNAYQHQHI